MAVKTDPPVEASRERRLRIRSLIEKNRRGRPRRRSFKELVIEGVLGASGYISIIIIALIFIFLFKEGIKAFIEIRPIQFLGSWVLDFDGNRVFTHTWQPVGEDPKYSLVPLALGSLLVALPATAMATLIGVGCGIYLAEIARPRLREVVKPIIELLAGIPSVVIGFLCLAALATLVQRIFGTTYRLNAFVGALGVTVVIIPIIASLTEDALRAVPDELREASHALGATRWQTIWKVLLPAGISGILASIILGMGRALGETMIVLMATGNAALVTGNIFSSVRTMTATIAAELGATAQGSQEYYAIFLVGTILFTITFFFNPAAEITINRMRKKLKL